MSSSYVRSSLVVISSRHFGTLATGKHRSRGAQRVVYNARLIEINRPHAPLHARDVTTAWQVPGDPWRGRIFDIGLRRRVGDDEHDTRCGGLPPLGVGIASAAVRVLMQGCLLSVLPACVKSLRWTCTAVIDRVDVWCRPCFGYSSGVLSAVVCDVRELANGLERVFCAVLIRP